MFSQEKEIKELNDPKALEQNTLYASTMSKQIETQAQTSFIGMSHITAGMHEPMAGISQSM